MFTIPDTCKGDSGSAFWKTEIPEGQKEPISTVLAVNSMSAGIVCGEAGLAYKIAHKDVLNWISQNWEK